MGRAVLALGWQVLVDAGEALRATAGDELAAVEVLRRAEPDKGAATEAQAAEVGEAPAEGPAREVRAPEEREAAAAEMPVPTEMDSVASCPSTQPTASSGCSGADTSYCYYGNTICACYPNHGAQRDGAGQTYSWGCGATPAGCPATVPVAGAACGQSGLTCNYDYSACAVGNPSLYVCQGGSWTFMAKPCS